MHPRLFGLFLLVPFWLAACHDDNKVASPTPPAGGSRGQLLKNPPTQIDVFSTTDVLTELGASTLGAELLTLNFSPTCTVTTYHLEYNTVGGQGEATSASGALMVPSGSSGRCQGPFPIVVYDHGTTPDKSFNIADITASSSTEGLLMAAVFASQGYLVVAPNYAGYDTSSLSYHPYLNADQQSKDTMDSLTAAQQAMTSLGIVSNGKLYVTGYSQGGYVAMATHRAMQQAGINVTASAPMSGPYALAAFGDAIFEGQVNNSGPVNVVLLASSYQHSYGNLYTHPTDLFEAAYASGIDTLLPSTEPIDTLYAQGRLPSRVLFSSTPPEPQFAPITPATQPAALAPVFAQGFGTGNLVTNAYRDSYLQDAMAQPDGGFPTVTTGLPAASPAHTLRQDLKQNDLRDWVPSAPVLLCAGSGDPTVFYFNTELMRQYWLKNAPPTAAIGVLDVDSAVADEDPYADEKRGFAAAKAALQLDSGTQGVFDGYHATLVPPFCLTAVKAFFDTH